MTLTYGCIRSKWYLCLQAGNGSILLKCRTYNGDTTEEQVERIQAEASRLGHLRTLLDSEVYAGSGRPKMVLEGLREKNRFNFT